MNFNIRGSKISITDAIRSYIETKIGKLDKYFENPDDITANVLIKDSGVNQKIEVTIPIKTTILRGESTHKDIYAAIDLVVDKLERQVRKNKTKITERYKNSALFEMVLDNIEDEEEEEFQIVKRKDIEMKPMVEEEAILQMNLINHDFFVFKNIDEECVSVLYKRKDGKYGIINVK